MAGFAIALVIRPRRPFVRRCLPLLQLSFPCTILLCYTRCKWFHLKKTKEEEIKPFMIFLSLLIILCATERMHIIILNFQNDCHRIFTVVICLFFYLYWAYTIVANVFICVFSCVWIMKLQMVWANNMYNFAWFFGDLYYCFEAQTRQHQK